MAETIEGILDDAYNLSMTLTSAEGKHVASLLSQARSDLRSAPALDSARSWRFALIAIACLIAAAVMGGYIIYSNAQTIQIQDQARATIASAYARAELEYYRGVYDSCTAFITNVIGESRDVAMLGCGQVMMRTYVDGWFSTESVGFVYPGVPEASKP